MPRPNIRSMKALWILLCALSLVVWPILAYASCTVQIITLPDGRTMMCQVCCFVNGNCTTHCN